MSREKRIAVGVLVIASLATFACQAVLGIDRFRACEGAECEAGTEAGTDVEGIDAPGDAGKEAGQPSCEGLAKTCGVNANDDCCASAIVDGGTFSLGLVDYETRDAAGAPTMATVSTFRLDKYLVTLGRFRQFVAATTVSQLLGGPWFPAVGSGKHTHIRNGQGLVGEPGWVLAFGSLPSKQEDWDNVLVNCAGLYVPAGPSWTITAQGAENRAVNCVSWEQAYAFCIWDGGFLPTYAELDYAAAGGSEQRVYPWSIPAADAAIGWTTANYSDPMYQCTGDPLLMGVGHTCEPGDYVAVGSKTGYGKWGHADLAGYFDEMTLDCDPVVDGGSTFDGTPCKDCVRDVLCPSTRRVTHGANYGDDPAALHTDIRRVEDAFGREWQGFRCARTP